MRNEMIIVENGYCDIDRFNIRRLRWKTEVRAIRTR